MPGGRPRVLPPDLDLYREHTEDGLTLAQLAEKYGASRSAVGNAVKRVKDAAKAGLEEELPKLPWVVSDAHTRDRIYDTVLAYRKHSAGHQCTAAEVRLADALRSHTTKLNAAVTYDYEKGFAYTNRLPKDGNAMFVVREGATRAPAR